MGSVVNYKSCPQCGGEYVEDFNYRTGDEKRVCFRCGRREKWKHVIDDTGEAVLDEQGNCVLEYSLQEGFGCAKVQYKNGFGQLINFNEPFNEEYKTKFLEWMKDDNLDVSNCYLTSWEPEKQELIAVFGTLPEVFNPKETGCEEDEIGSLKTK